MRTKELAKLLATFAELSEFERSDGLYRLANCFAQGRDETVLARLKRMTPAQPHPLILKQSVQAIHAGFVAAGAKKQASAIADVLSLFAGHHGGTVESFVQQISRPPEDTALTQARGKNANHKVVDLVLAELNKGTLTAETLHRLVLKLRSRHFANAATLALLADRYLGHQTTYRDRKSAIKAITEKYASLAKS